MKGNGGKKLPKMSSEVGVQSGTGPIARLARYSCPSKCAGTCQILITGVALL